MNRPTSPSPQGLGVDTALGALDIDVAFRALEFDVALRAALACFKLSPVRQLAWTMAMAISALSIPLGVGLVLTPWALSHLVITQLELRSTRGGWRAWLTLGLAGGLWLFAVLLALLSTGGGAMGAGAQRWVWCVCVTWVWCVFVTPLRWVPWLLLDRNSGATGFYSAVLCSVRMGQRSRGLTRGAWLLSGALSVLAPPLGVGMMTAGYLAAREAEKCEVPGARPNRFWAWLWSVLILSPVLVSTCLLLAVVPPSNIPIKVEGAAHAGQVIQEVSALSGESRILYPPGTSLQVEVSANVVRVEASDGGGVGRLPLPDLGPVLSVRLLSTQNGFEVEVSQLAGVSHTEIDREGVRLDDDLTARWVSQVPVATRWGLLLWWLGLAMVSRSALGQMIDVGKGARRTPLWWGLALTPLTVWAVWMGWCVML